MQQDSAADVRQFVQLCVECHEPIMGCHLYDNGINGRGACTKPLRSANADDLRAKGWEVAVHNDYRQNGKLQTFWLLTNTRLGRFAKGEGSTDAEALDAVRHEIKLLADEGIA